MSTAAGDEETAAPPEAALEELAAVYRDLHRELAGIAVRCDLRGVCCDFERSGQVLFATDLELEHARRNGAASVPDGSPDACPWFVGGLCRLREGRPLGCRTYFCDPGFADRMQEIGERYHRRIVEIHDRHGVPYRYMRFTRTIRREPAR